MPQGKQISVKTRRVVAIGTLLLVMGLLLSPLASIVDRYSYDSLFLLRGKQLPNPGVAVVAIDEESFNAIGKPWPWPRGKHAELIRALFRAGARAVAFDVVFAGASIAEDDAELSEVLHQFGPVVLASDYDLVDDPRFAREVLVLPYQEFLTPTVRTGHVNYPLDADSFLRRLKIRPSESRPFAWEAARTYRNGLPTPAESGGERLINFVGPARTISTASYYQALDPEHFLPANFFLDKLVFVGLSTSSNAKADINTRDHFPTPFSRIGAQQTSGVEVHATVAANFLDDSFIVPVSSPVVFTLSTLLAAVCLILFAAFSPLAGLAVAIICGVATVISSYLLFVHKQLYLSYSTICLPIAISYFSSLLSHYLNVRLERNFIRQTFSHYVSPGVVSELLKHPDKLQLGGTRVTGSVLFLDIAGFTTFSERLTPEQLISVLNRNMGALSDIIISGSGMVDKYIGDAIMAVWGVPISNNNHARDACLAALQISEKIDSLTQEELKLTGVELAIRIGINSGEMVAGNIGGQHVNYTVLGNTVNLASRIEGANRTYQTAILIGESTAELAGPEFLTRHIDTLRVKGQTLPSKLFELVAIRADAPELAARRCSLFSKAREHYVRRNWLQALELFSALLIEFPDDGPSLTLQRRCREFLITPPAPDWDGVYDMETK